MIDLTNETWRSNRLLEQEARIMEKMTYKYNPSDYDEVLCEYMTAFYRAYEEKNQLYMSLEMQHLYSETKYAMKEGDISSSDREEMLTYFGELLYG
jgi:hypothetical protein